MRHYVLLGLSGLAALLMVSAGVVGGHQLGALRCDAVPTPTVDPSTLVALPDPDFIIASLGQSYASFTIITPYGLSPETRVYLGFEAPVGSGHLYLATFAIVDGWWSLIETRQIDSRARGRDAWRR